MALDIKTMVTEATNTPTSKGDTAFNNRLEALRAKMADVTIHFENLDKEAYKSKETLSKFNSSLRGASHAVERLEKDLKDVRSKIFAAGGVPAEFRQGIEKYKAIGVSVSELVKVQNEIGKSLAKLKGPATSAAAFRSLASSLARGQRALPSEGPIRASFAGGLSSAAGQLYGAMAARGAAQIGRAGAQPTFSMVGKGIVETLDSKLMKDQLRDQRTASAQARMYSMRGPGMFEAMYEGEHPSPRLGKNYRYNKGLLPMPAGGGGGGGGGIGGPPTRYMGPAGLPGPYMGGIREQEFWTRGTSRPWRSRYQQDISEGEIGGQRSSWGPGVGDLVAGAFGLLPELSLYKAGRFLVNQYTAGSAAELEGFHASRFGAVGPTSYNDYHALLLGNARGDMVPGVGGMPGASPAVAAAMKDLSTAGVLPEERMAMARSYSMGPGYGLLGAMRATATAKVSPGIGFEETPEIMQRLESYRTFGYGGGVHTQMREVDTLSKAVQIGMTKAGMPQTQSLENIDNGIELIARSMGSRMPGQAGLVGRINALSASSIPALRTGAGIQEGISSLMGANEDIVNRPYLYTLMAHSMGGSRTVNAGTFKSFFNKYGGKGAGNNWMKSLDPKVVKSLNDPRINPSDKLAFLFENDLVPPFLGMDVWRGMSKSMGIPPLLAERAAASSGMFGAGSRKLALHEFGFGGTGDYLSGKGLNPLKGAGAPTSELDSFMKGNPIISDINKNLVNMTVASLNLKSAISDSLAPKITGLTSSVDKVSSYLPDIIEGLWAGLKSLGGGAPFPMGYHPGGPIGHSGISHASSTTLRPRTHPIPA